MDADLDTLATALYVTTDDFLIDNPQHRPWRPKVGYPAPRRRRTGHPGSAASAARIHLRGAMVALRGQPAARAVPLSADTIGLQQARSRGDRNAARGHRASGGMHLSVHR